MVTTVRTIKYKFKEVGEGGMIGAEEFILVDVPRCVEATAITDCELGYIEQEDFFKRKKFLSIRIL
jgi:CRP-like cAMP-binding protein